MTDPRHTALWNLLNKDREREVPVILPTGEVIMIKSGDFDSVVGTIENVERSVPMILGMSVLFTHLEPISNNLYVFYTDHRVVTSYDLTVVVINKDDQIVKKGTVSELCANNTFARFMDILFNDYAVAFAYPATIRNLFEKKKAPIMKPDVTDEWVPLLNGNRINANGEVIPRGVELKSKGVAVRILSEDELPQDTAGNKADIFVPGKHSEPGIKD